MSISRKYLRKFILCTSNKSKHISSIFLAVGTIIGQLSFTGIASHAQPLNTTTPIKHLVVLFPENISFDHYFGTYPYAANIPEETLEGSGQPAAKFFRKRGTQIPNNYLKPSKKPGLHSLKPELFTRNDRKNGGYIPFRIPPSQALTCDQNHQYTDEQEAFNNGRMDQFFQVNAAGNEDCKNPKSMLKRNDLVMGYFDGNTVTAYWNLAQYFVLNDNNYGSIFGPSTPGHLNLIAGQTSYATAYNPFTRNTTFDPSSIVYAGNHGDKNQGSLVSDLDPYYDDCSNHNGQGSDALVEISAPNIGDSLNTANITWGWFQGGFRPDKIRKDGRAVCTYAHENIGGLSVLDYSPHHEPFQYFKSTANPHHNPPSNKDMIGRSDQANHQYDMQDFYTALATHNLPAVSFVKPPAYQDGHAEYSDPIDENHFAAYLVNQLEQSSEWSSTALIIIYDDSDGWYDHQPAIIQNGSHTSADRKICTSVPRAVDGLEGRCGPGTRHPLLIVSPYVKSNIINHVHTEQTSVIRFIEDNWQLPRLDKGSFDRRAGLFNSMFNFSAPPRTDKIWLDEATGALTTQNQISPLHEGTPYPSNSAQPSQFDRNGKILVILLIGIAVFVGGISMLARKLS